MIDVQADILQTASSLFLFNNYKNNNKILFANLKCSNICRAIPHLRIVMSLQSCICFLSGRRTATLFVVQILFLLFIKKQYKLYRFLLFLRRSIILKCISLLLYLLYTLVYLQHRYILLSARVCHRIPEI